MCGAMKQPVNTSTSRELGRLFKGSSSSGPSSSRKRPLTFDPSAECVALPQQSKKKRAIRNRTCRMSVFLINDVKRGVPRGNYRKDLRKKGKEAIVEVRRNMSPQQVKRVISKNFCIPDFEILSATQDGKLRRADFQCLSGDNAVDVCNGGKASLYITEVRPKYFKKNCNILLFQDGI